VQQRRRAGAPALRGAPPATRVAEALSRELTGIDGTQECAEYAAPCEASGGGWLQSCCLALASSAALRSLQTQENWARVGPVGPEGTGAAPVERVVVAEAVARPWATLVPDCWVAKSMLGLPRRQSARQRRRVVRVLPTAPLACA
jgi:hypothetical protein